MATDPTYTYDNLIDTDDVEQFFSRSSGKDLKPLFDFYLRTTNYLELHWRQSGFNTYQVKCTNLPMPLKMDILTDKGNQQIDLSDKWVTIKSSFPPVADPRGFYLKNVKSN